MDVAAHVFALTMLNRFMIIIFSEQPITGMLVSSNQRNVIGNSGANESVQRFCIGIVNDPSDDIALASDSANDRNLAGSSASIEPLIFVLVLFFSTNESFINLDFATKRSHEVTVHRSAPAHTHIPTGVIVGTRIFAENNAVNLKRADSLFAYEHKIANLEPKFQRLFCILKNGLRDHRETIAIATTAHRVFANPVKRAGLKCVNILVATARTFNAFRPAHLNKKLFARFFGRKLFIKGINCFHTPKVTQKIRGVNSNPIALF